MSLIPRRLRHGATEVCSLLSALPWCCIVLNCAVFIRAGHLGLFIIFVRTIQWGYWRKYTTFYKLLRLRVRIGRCVRSLAGTSVHRGWVGVAAGACQTVPSNCHRLCDVLRMMNRCDVKTPSVLRDSKPVASELPNISVIDLVQSPLVSAGSFSRKSRHPSDLIRS